MSKPEWYAPLSLLLCTVLLLTGSAYMYKSVTINNYTHHD